MRECVRRVSICFAQVRLLPNIIIHHTCTSISVIIIVLEELSLCLPSYIPGIPRTRSEGFDRSDEIAVHLRRDQVPFITGETLRAHITSTSLHDDTRAPGTHHTHSESIFLNFKPLVLLTLMLFQNANVFVYFCTNSCWPEWITCTPISSFIAIWKLQICYWTIAAFWKLPISDLRARMYTQFVFCSVFMWCFYFFSCLCLHLKQHVRNMHTHKQCALLLKFPMHITPRVHTLLLSHTLSLQNTLCSKKKKKKEA